jgi:peptidoglycan/xylan/chitin deacetylase (PgdA/CDA1 family)
MSVTLDALWRRGVKRGLIAGGLETANLIARAGMLRKARGRGAIFTLHHVRPPQTSVIAPNAHLEVTPQFLEQAIEQLAADGYEFIALDALPARLASPQTRPFACFTLDDGYRNNAEHALPVFERHGVPFTIFVSEGFAERRVSLWWETVAQLLANIDSIGFDFGAGEERLDIACSKRKLDVFDRFSSYVQRDDETKNVAEIDRLASRHDVDALGITAALTMDSAELVQLSRHPLVSLGAHTPSHRALSRLSEAEARREMQNSADWLEQLTGRRPTTIAYPYGTTWAVTEREPQLAKALGYEVAVTTQPGTISERDHDALTALPRISLNGYYQTPRYVSALASGIPFTIRAA